MADGCHFEKVKSLPYHGNSSTVRHDTWYSDAHCSSVLY